MTIGHCKYWKHKDESKKLEVRVTDLLFWTLFHEKRYFSKH